MATGAAKGARHRIAKVYSMTEQWYIEKKVFADGSVAYVHSMTYGKGRISYSLDEDTVVFEACWCYETVDKALAGLRAWDKDKEIEPDGWFREPHSGRRRPDGDKSAEHVNW